MRSRGTVDHDDEKPDHVSDCVSFALTQIQTAIEVEYEQDQQIGKYFIRGKPVTPKLPSSQVTA